MTDGQTQAQQHIQTSGRPFAAGDRICAWQDIDGIDGQLAMHAGQWAMIQSRYLNVIWVRLDPAPFGLRYIGDDREHCIRLPAMISRGGLQDEGGNRAIIDPTTITPTENKDEN